VHDIVLQRAERLFIQTGFAVDMSVMLSSTNGPVGTPITVDDNRIGWRPLESSWMLLYDNNFPGYRACCEPTKASVTAPKIVMS
jgi:hypothetical protein